MGQAKKGLRTGYTTGSCAAAAAKAAAVALRTQRAVQAIEITLPAGEIVEFKVKHCDLDVSQALCSVVKDAGDDPDVTNGAEIAATVRWSGRPGLTIDRGEGVGLVTKPGLELEVGSPAINLVPKKMISYSVQEGLGGDLSDRGVEVIISVPNGAKLAKKTLNERLGIVGGISILGTTGIVKPFSTSAYKACIVQALNVALANGCTKVVLTTGGRTEKYAQRILSLPDEAFIQMGDFAGFSLRQCAAKGFGEVTIVAMIGKLTKIAAGSFQTHVSRSRVDAGFLAGLAASCGLPVGVVEQAKASNTARHFSEILSEEQAGCVYTRMCEIAAGRCTEYMEGSLAVECILVGFDGQVLGRRRSGV